MAEAFKNAKSNNTDSISQAPLKDVYSLIQSDKSVITCAYTY